MAKPTLRLMFGLMLVGVFGPLISAYAHSTLVRSSPAVNEQLAAAPVTIALFFDSELDVSASEFRLFDADEQPVAGVVGRVDLTDPDHARLVAENLPRLPDGVYVIKWLALSLDGDAVAVTGEFQFSINVPAPAQPTQLATALISVTPTLSPTPAPVSPAGFEVAPEFLLSGIILSIGLMLLGLLRRK